MNARSTAGPGRGRHGGRRPPTHRTTKAEAACGMVVAAACAIALIILALCAWDLI